MTQGLKQQGKSFLPSLALDLLRSVGWPHFFPILDRPLGEMAPKTPISHLSSLVTLIENPPPLFLYLLISGKDFDWLCWGYLPTLERLTVIKEAEYYDWSTLGHIHSTLIIVRGNN